ncbi:MAG TPA: hypothetical protein DCS66_23580 [Flavobacteriaceae bacterium]|nr:hypothetical protein [Flavobacteriaceae bacterium]
MVASALGAALGAALGPTPPALGSDLGAALGFPGITPPQTPLPLFPVTGTQLNVSSVSGS